MRNSGCTANKQGSVKDHAGEVLTHHGNSVPPAMVEVPSWMFIDIQLLMISLSRFRSPSQQPSFAYQPVASLKVALHNIAWVPEEAHSFLPSSNYTCFPLIKHRLARKRCTWILVVAGPQSSWRQKCRVQLDVEYSNSLRSWVWLLRTKATKRLLGKSDSPILKFELIFEWQSITLESKTTRSSKRTRFVCQNEFF